MTMRTVHHTGIIVKDLDRSIYFYHDILGLEFSNEPSPWFEGDDLASAVGVPGAKLRQVSLWVGDSATLELLEYANRPADNDSYPAELPRCNASRLPRGRHRCQGGRAEGKRSRVPLRTQHCRRGVLAKVEVGLFPRPRQNPSRACGSSLLQGEEERKKGIAEYLANRPLSNPSDKPQNHGARGL